MWHPKFTMARPLTVAATAGCAAVLAWTPSVDHGVRLLTDALIMDATTFPVPSQGYMDSAIADFIAPTVPDDSGYNPVAVRQASQIIGINNSADQGVEYLLDALEGRTGPVAVFGFSQSTVAAMRVKAELAERAARGEDVPDVTFVGIGVGNRPNGGISQRFAGVTIPFFDFTFDGAAPTDTGFTTIDIARQYDGLADTPQFPLAVVSTANAIFGILFSHALYGPEVSLDPDSPKYVNGTVTQQYGDTTYYWIPTADLPLLDPFRLIGIPEEVIDVFEPFVTELVELGYDRSVPFGEPTPAQLIPVTDPVTFAIRLVRAVVEGANNAAAIVGAQLPGYDELSAQLAAAETQSAATIGVPYRDVVREINENINPFQAFAAIEGPIAEAVGSVLNPLGVPWALNQIIDPVLFPVTAWAEENLLFPQPDADPDPFADSVIQILRRVAPNLDLPAPDTSSSSGNVDTEITSAAAPEADSGLQPDRGDEPRGSLLTQRIKEVARTAEQVAQAAESGQRDQRERLSAPTTFEPVDGQQRSTDPVLRRPSSSAHTGPTSAATERTVTGRADDEPTDSPRQIRANRNASASTGAQDRLSGRSHDEPSNSPRQVGPDRNGSTNDTAGAKKKESD